MIAGREIQRQIVASPFVDDVGAVTGRSGDYRRPGRAAIAGRANAILDHLALRFRQSEALVSVRGRKPMTDAFAVVIGAGSSARMISRQFDLSERHRATVDKLADELASNLQSKGLDIDVLLAALARAGLKLTSDDSAEIEHG